MALPVLFAVGLVGGIVAFAIREAKTPTIKPDREKRRLARLIVRFPRIRLDEAEDGLVLARRYGDKRAIRKFAQAVLMLRKKRAPV